MVMLAGISSFVVQKIVTNLVLLENAFPKIYKQMQVEQDDQSSLPWFYFPSGHYSLRFTVAWIW
jgi:hypothetical protein